MRNFLLLFVFSFFMIFIFSCKPKQIPINIINLNKAQGLRQYSNIYSLPKTVIRVKVSVERLNYAKGPYSQYALSYMGLNNVIEQDGHSWQISNVEFETFPISDTNNLYLIETSEEFNPILINLDNRGFLESINEPLVSENQNGQSLYINDSKKSDGSNTNIALDNNSSISFDDVPLPKAILAKKSIGEQATAFANTILTLRDDRAAIIVGDGYTNALPEGKTLETMIKNIDEIQEKYMSMFVGKTTSQTFVYYFDFIPSEPRKTTQDILFRFSEQNGVVDNSDMSGMPVIIEIESYENLKQFEQFKKRQYYLEQVAEKDGIEKGLYYRIPELGIVKLIKNDKVLMEEKVQIAQFGSIQHLPYKYLNGDYTIKFFPELGSINSITLNKKDDNLKKDKKN